MKQLFLSVLAVAIALLAYTQKEYRSNKKFAKAPFEKTHVKYLQSDTPKQVNKVELKEGRTPMIDRFTIGKSANIYSVLSSNYQYLSYDPISDVLLASFRSDPASYPGTTAGAIIGHHSSTGGIHWEPTVLINPDPLIHKLYNPSSTIYNPNASSNNEDIYALSAGKAYSGLTWDSIYIGSAKLDSTNIYHGYYPMEEDDVIHSRMIAIQDHLHLFGTSYIQVIQGGEGQTMKHYDFATNNPDTGFLLESVNEYEPDWLIDPNDGHAYALYNTWSAWALDGSIGYMWMIGVTNETYDYGVYQPQLAYTTDGGNTWNPLSINLEDHPTLVQYLPPWEDAAGNPGTVRPSFLTPDRTFPGVVAYEGKLHLFSNVYGSSRGDVLDPENGYWVVNEQRGGHIFDFVIDQTGLIDIILVDSLRTDIAPDNSFGDVGWTHRLQACKSPDEWVMFCVWCEDTDPSHEEVLNPDIFGWAYDPGGMASLEATNFTGDDLFSGFFFFHYLSELVNHNPGEEMWWLNISTSLSLTEFQANDPNAPVTHTFLKGIGVCTSNIEEKSLASSSISLTQNIPNPATTQTSFTITTKDNSHVKLKVTNIMGQEVFSKDLGTIKENKKVHLDLSEFESGVYFYTVTASGVSAAKKMIVK